MKLFHWLLAFCFVVIACSGLVLGFRRTKGNSLEPEFTLSDIQLPPGFKIKSYTGGRVTRGRSLALSTSAEFNETILYVSTRRSDKVFAVVDEDGDGEADRVHVMLSGMDTPNGIAWRNGSLYVAVVDKVLRYDDVDRLALKGKKFRDPVLIRDGFPDTGHHYWKYIGFDPDDKLFIAVGIGCNRCVALRYGKVLEGTIMRMNPDGSRLEVFVKGLRNSVGFDWHPVTGEFFFTENGADGLGDNFPDDTLHIGLNKGDDFGFPHCLVEGVGDPYERKVGESIIVRDPFFGNDCKARNRKEPVQALGPHVAALGMRFYTGDMFPKRYKNSIFIAEHGSWDRSEKIGFRVVNVKLADDNRTAVNHEIFASGWERSGKTFGRPVDVQELPDGSLLVSDDFADDVYRITYERKQNRRPKRTKKER